MTFEQVKAHAMGLGSIALATVLQFELLLRPGRVGGNQPCAAREADWPVILSEHTQEPYKPRTFAQTWRRVADKAGLPHTVWNMDARAGAISEAYEAGGGETDVLKHAGHKIGRPGPL